MEGVVMTRANFYGVVVPEGVVSFPVPKDIAAKLEETGPDASNVETRRGGACGELKDSAWYRSTPISGTKYSAIE